MASRILKRTLSFLLTLLLVSAVVFVALDRSGGDSSSFVLADDASPEAVEAYREAVGLNRSLLERYLKFLVGFVTLDWGRTIGGQEIRTVVAQRLPLTLSLTFWSMVLSLLFSLFFALLAARRKGGLLDRTLTVLSSLFLILPSFLSSLVLVLVFAVALKWFPVAGYSPINKGILAHFRALFLPSLTLAILHASLMLRLFREALEENLSSLFALSARGKGMKRKSLPLRSALKPSLGVMLSVLGEGVATTLGGASVVETVFALPGLGTLMVQSALSRDFMTSGILMMLVAVLVSLVFFLSDLLCYLSDPRERRTYEEN